jgi:hypothetical protein
MLSVIPTTGDNHQAGHYEGSSQGNQTVPAATPCGIPDFSHNLLTSFDGLSIELKPG